MTRAFWVCLVGAIVSHAELQENWVKTILTETLFKDRVASFGCEFSQEDSIALKAQIREDITTVVEAVMKLHTDEEMFFRLDYLDRLNRNGRPMPVLKKDKWVGVNWKMLRKRGGSRGEDKEIKKLIATPRMDKKNRIGYILDYLYVALDGSDLKQINFEAVWSDAFSLKNLWDVLAVGVFNDMIHAGFPDSDWIRISSRLSTIYLAQVVSDAVKGRVMTKFEAVWHLKLVMRSNARIKSLGVFPYDFKKGLVAELSRELETSSGFGGFSNGERVKSRLAQLRGAMSDPSMFSYKGIDRILAGAPPRLAEAVFFEFFTKISDSSRKWMLLEVLEELLGVMASSDKPASIEAFTRFVIQQLEKIPNTDWIRQELSSTSV